MRQCKKAKQKHPWDAFLDARAEAIQWMAYELKQDDDIIALDLSMDETQVRLIREHLEKYPD